MYITCTGCEFCWRTGDIMMFYLLFIALIAVIAFIIAQLVSVKSQEATMQDPPVSSEEFRVEEGGIDERDKMIIDLLYREGPLGVSDIARKLGLSKSVVWRKLHKLVEAGIVERVTVRGKPLYKIKQ